MLHELSSSDPVPSYILSQGSLSPSLFVSPQIPKCFTLDIEIFSESLVVLALLAFVVGAQVSGKHRESLRCSSSVSTTLK